MACTLLLTGMTWTFPQRSIVVCVLLAASLPTASLLARTVGQRVDTADVACADDTALEHAVGDALGARLGESGSRIRVHAEGSVVTLAGAVADQATRDRAEKIAYGVGAVERVENQLRIPRPPMNPRGM